MILHHWTVIDTPMRPKRWKVVHKRRPDTNNSWTEYFENRVDAVKEAARRDSRELV